jgi:hypothetical protein
MRNRAGYTRLRADDEDEARWGARQRRQARARARLVCARWAPAVRFSAPVAVAWVATTRTRAHRVQHVRVRTGCGRRRAACHPHAGLAGAGAAAVRGAPRGGAVGVDLPGRVPDGLRGSSVRAGLAALDAVALRQGAGGEGAPRARAGGLPCRDCAATGPWARPRWPRPPNQPHPRGSRAPPPRRSGSPWWGRSPSCQVRREVGGGVGANGRREPARQCAPGARAMFAPTRPPWRVRPP